MEIKVISFDLDGVYFPVGKAKFISNLIEYGVNEDEAKRVFLKSPQMNSEYKNGKMTDEEYWNWAISEWKLNTPWERLVNIMTDGYEVDKNVVEIVKKIRSLGYMTAICSNNFPARINGLQERFNFLNDFDVKVFSYEVGASKPDTKIFEALVARSGEEPASIVFADDNQDNLAGAQNVGITAFLYEGFEKYLEQLGSVGVKI